jgi:hypothetical protein
MSRYAAAIEITLFITPMNIAADALRFSPLLPDIFITPHLRFRYYFHITIAHS